MCREENRRSEHHRRRRLGFAAISVLGHLENGADAVSGHVHFRGRLFGGRFAAPAQLLPERVAGD